MLSWQKKQGKDLNKLFRLVDILSQNKPLEEKYRDHSLGGNYSKCRECHIEPDWLLIYIKDNDVLVLTLIRVGSHSDLFN